MSLRQQEAECFVCHQKIYINKPSPDSKWIKTNLDGSVHVDPKQPKKQQEQEQSTASAPTLKEKKGWEDAHDENMDRQDKMIAKLDTLITTLGNLTQSNMSITAATANLSQEVKSFKNAISDYLASGKRAD